MILSPCLIGSTKWPLGGSAAPAGKSARLADKGKMHGDSKSATARKIMYTCGLGTIVDERLGVGLWLPSPKGC